MITRGGVNHSVSVESYGCSCGSCNKLARIQMNSSAHIAVYDSMYSESRATSSGFLLRTSSRTPPRPRWVQRIADVLLRRRIRLSGDQRAGLFQLFADLHGKRPSLLPGVARVPGTTEHFLLSEISYPLLRRYDGFEIAVFDERFSVYYRMPGAGIGGSGSVADGRHALCLDHWNLPGPVYLQIDKTPRGALRVAAISTSAEQGVSYQLVAGHHLDHAKLCFELEEKVYRCLLWHLLSSEHMPAVVANLGRETMCGWFDACAALGPRLAELAAEWQRRAAETVLDSNAPARSPS